jgi:hypothetical protein
VEEVNGLTAHSIVKARWIKLEYRRSHDQRLAHATLSISLATTANRLIRDGMHICGTKIFPAKLKQEPIQCMKCRKWGHVVAACLEASDTCGTCGGKHQTRSCNTTDKIHCMSCKTDVHTSWDRNCPEFIRQCMLHNEKHPENNLIFFPMEEDWTLAVTPDRIPLNKHFPQKYTVASHPPPSNKT